MVALKIAFSLRSAVRAGLATLAFALAVAGTATAVAVVSSSGPGYSSKAKTSVWTSCVTATSTYLNIDSCSSIDPSSSGCIGGPLQASRAFDILLILAIVFAGIGLAVVDLLALLPAPKAKLILIASAAVQVVLGLIAWPIKVSLFTNSCAGSSMKDTPGASYGPGPWLLLVAWLFTIAMIPAAIFLPGPPETVGTETMQQLAKDMTRSTEGNIVLSHGSATGRSPYGFDVDL